VCVDETGDYCLTRRVYSLPAYVLSRNVSARTDSDYSTILNSDATVFDYLPGAIHRYYGPAKDQQVHALGITFPLRGSVWQRVIENHGE
jgi:hypothetical protein